MTCPERHNHKKSSPPVARQSLTKKYDARMANLTGVRQKNDQLYTTKMPSKEGKQKIVNAPYQHHQIFWITDTGLGVAMINNLPSMWKEKIEQMSYIKKVTTLVDSFALKQLSSGFIPVCVAKGINYQDDNITQKIAHKAKARKIFISTCLAKSNVPDKKP